MTTQTSAPSPQPLVRMNVETLQYEPTGYVIHRYAAHRVFIGAEAGDQPTFLLRLPHPEVLTRVSEWTWAYDPPLSEQDRAFLDALARGVAARGLS